LQGKVRIIKVNRIAYKYPEIVEIIKKKGFDVWRDFKHHDIPRSAAGFVKADVEGLVMTTVHTLGGAKMMEYVAKVAEGSDLEVLAVTILTSHDQASLNRELGIPGTIKQSVVRLALMAERAGLGIVCSAKEATILRKILKPTTLIVTPGIKPLWAVEEKDQARVTTPYQAIMNGSDYIVVGSAIYKSENPAVAADKIVAEIKKALLDRKKKALIIQDETEMFMSQEDIRKIFSEAKAVILDDHFVYKSTKHGSAYVNKDRIFFDPVTISSLGFEIACRFINDEVDVVIGPVVGGAILSQWTAYHLSALLGKKVFAVFADKDGDDFIIKRGYDKFLPNSNVLVVEDIVTTGGSAIKVIKQVLSCGGKIAGLGILCNRGNVSFDVPKFLSLLTIDLKAWDEKECPLCAKGVPVNVELGKGKQFLARQ